MKSRVQKIHPEKGWPSRIDVFDLSHQMPRMDEGGLEVIDAWLGQHPGARLVVIDTLQRFRSKKGTTKGMYAADVDEIEPLQQMAIRHGVAVVVVHHYNKAMHDDWIDAVSGSSGIGGTADTIWGVERPRGRKGQKDGRLRITGRDVEEQDLTMSLVDYRWKILGDHDEQETSGEAPAMQELLTYMRRRPWETYGISEIQVALNKPSYDSARVLLNRALAVGIIRKRGRGMFGLPAAAEQDTGVYSNGSFGSVVSGTEQETPLDKPNEQNTEHPLIPSSGWGTRTGVLPDKPCATCGQIAWSLRVGARPMCDICHPAVGRVDP
jgi:hypothetical protein